MFLVSEIFDTFKMLGTLQRVMEMRIPEDTKRNYISRIKEINTILQTYEIGEMMIENCTLDESSTVFSRINSKGTDISRVEMLQALTYKNRSSILLAEKIDEIISSLSVYGFANMKPDDILNCCAKYIGKNFYDNNLMDILAKEDFSQFIDQLRVNVTKAVRFLNEECHVISYKLLPYNRQLIAIANFFKEKSNPSQEELAELKRWFFYTTYQQLFQNSSLGNVRSIFTRFDEFVRGDTLEAIDYHPIEIDSLMDIKFSTSSAMSNFVVLCQIAKRKSLDSSENMSYIGEYKYSGDKVSGVFALLNSDDRNIINAIIRGEEIEDDLTKYLLNEDIVTSMRNKDVFQVRRKRRRFIVDEIADFLHSLALVLEGDDEQPNNVIEQPSNDIDELISEFEDLNNEEKRELCSILSSGNEASSVIFTIEKSEDGNVLISYPSFSKTYVLTPQSSTTCLRKIETMFCNGEDAEGYYSWRLALDKDD